MNRLLDMLREEDGAVSVDFVVLSAGVVTMAMLIAPMLVSPVSNLAEFVGDEVAEYGKMIPQD